MKTKKKNKKKQRGGKGTRPLRGSAKKGEGETKRIRGEKNRKERGGGALL